MAPYEVPGFPELIGTFMGRDALTLAIEFLDLHPRDAVLAPVYTCQDVVKQLVNKYSVEFYDVGPGFVIDPDEIRMRLGKRHAKLLLITNYFGFLQPFRDELKRICSERGVCLIEDCAHSLLTEGSGVTGDIAIYSFRKILPVRDGGGLRTAWKDQFRNPSFHPRIYSDVLSILAKAKSLLNLEASVFSRAQVTSSAVKRLTDETSINAKRRILPISGHARRKVGRVSLPVVVARRREDFGFWLEVCSRSRGIVAAFDSLPSGVCPFGFPVKVHDRYSVESRARSAGIPLRVHWRLDPTLATDCSTSHELSAHTLTLPLYPAIGKRDRERLAQIVVT